MQIGFSEELRNWILHNLERGCQPAQLIESMVAQRFDPGIAREIIAAFVRARAAGIEPPRDTVTLAENAESAESALAYRYEPTRIASGTRLRAAGRHIDVALRIGQPAIALLDRVLDADECATLIELARNRLRPSTVVDPETGADTVVPGRSSLGMFFQRAETPFIAMLEQRFADIMNCPLENGEGLQVLHYPSGAASDAHFDFLLPSNPANRASLERSGQRISSLVLYLNEVEGGGETVFPRIDLAVSPRHGCGVYFEYANRSGQVDELSLHASAPVTAGEKWVVTQWMRERAYPPG